MMSTTPQALLFDHGPLNQITSSTAGFNIGATLSATGPGVTARYSETWQQPSVTTTDKSNLAQGVGMWNEAFVDEGVFTVPPETSIGLFLSHQGSIFQVPEGTSSFPFTLDEPVTSAFQPHFGNLQTSVSDYFLQINIFPPVFAVSLNDLAIQPGGSGSFDITAVNPSTSSNGLGLSWDVINLPAWLTVSQTSGSSSARLILNVAPGTALGTVGSLNINTNPAFAAPSVEENPLLVRVTVGQPTDTGVLLTGGQDVQGGPGQDTADLYSPQLGVMGAHKIHLFTSFTDREQGFHNNWRDFDSEPIQTGPTRYVHRDCEQWFKWIADRHSPIPRRRECARHNLPQWRRRCTQSFRTHFRSAQDYSQLWRKLEFGRQRVTCSR